MSDIRRVALLSVHTCPLAMLGGKKTGGMNVYVRDLSRELSRRGVAVDVFTRQDEDCREHLDDSRLAEHARVVHIPAGPETLEPPAMAPHMPAFVEGVKAYARQEGTRYDLLHSHYWLSGWAAEELRAAWDVPILHMFHTLGHMKNRVASEEGEAESPLRIEVETRLVGSVDGIVAATPAERIQLIWLYEADMRKIRVVPPGVDTQRFRPLPGEEARREVGLEPEEMLLLFVGRIERLKGLETLIHAAALMDGHHKNVCIAVVGGDPDGLAPDENEEMARLVQLRDEMGMSDLITFLGARDQDRLPYYYSAAEALVMPSYYESFGLVALEAMACGTPVIASEVGGLAYLVQDGVTGFHVPDRDAEQLAGKIRLLLENSALRDEMAEAAIAHARTYDWSLIADQLLAVYEDLLAAERP